MLYIRVLQKWLLILHLEKKKHQVRVGRLSRAAVA